MVGAFPRAGGDVGEVAGVEVAVRCGVDCQPISGKMLSRDTIYKQKERRT